MSESAAGVKNGESSVTSPIAKADVPPPRFLSFDGGGVKGYSSLIILQHIMEEIQRREGLEKTPHPGEYFELIGGTSTGGLIAFMIGRLHMSVESCIDTYTNLSRIIFKTSVVFPVTKYFYTWFNRPWFDAGLLETEIKDVIVKNISEEEKRQLEARGVKPEDAPVGDPELLTTHATKVFVCAYRVAESRAIRIRTYHQKDGDKPDDCKIWEACRATSAAPFYFAEMKLRLRPDKPIYEYYDGGLTSNNPIIEVKNESDAEYPEYRIPKVVISIGTGKPDPGKTPEGFWDKVLDMILGGYSPMARLLAVLMGNTQARHEDIVGNDENKDFRTNYTRFNAGGGVAEIGMEEWKKLDEIKALTKAYLATEDVKKDIERCVDHILSK